MSTSIVSYQKVSTPHTVIQALLPDSTGVDDSLHCIELCTLDGITYLAVPDGVTLPPQPIGVTLEAVTLTPELRERIKAESVHSQWIGERMVQKIRARYSIDDEMFFARIGVGAATGMYSPSPGELADMQAFGEFVEGVRQWGRDERAKLGL
jgi:hypothetical protein